MSSPLRYEWVDWLVGTHTSGISAVAFSPDGLYLATAGLDSQVCVFRISDLQLHHTFAGSSAVLSLEWMTTENTTLMFGTLDGMVCVLSLSPVSTFPDIRQSRSQLCHSEDNKLRGSGLTTLESSALQ